MVEIGVHVSGDSYARIRVSSVSGRVAATVTLRFEPENRDVVEVCLSPDQAEGLRKALGVELQILRERP